MLELAEVKKGDVLYDLGSGDGRIVIRAAQKYGIHAVGIEMDQLLLDQARKDAKAAGVAHLVEFRDEDALKADISPASVITLYMLPWFNETIKPNLQTNAKARPPASSPTTSASQDGSRIVTVKLPGYELNSAGISTSIPCICGELGRSRLGFLNLR